MRRWFVSYTLGMIVGAVLLVGTTIMGGRGFRWESIGRL